MFRVSWVHRSVSKPGHGSFSKKYPLSGLRKIKKFTPKRVNNRRWTNIGKNQNNNCNGKIEFATWQNNCWKLASTGKLRRELLKYLVWSLELYDVETWTLLSGDIARLEVFEMWM